MGLRLVNTSPGTDPTPVKPGQPIQLGLKSDDGLVGLGSLRLSAGLTSIANEGILPEDDPNFESRGARVAYETPERVRPVTGTVSREFESQNIVFAKVDDSQADFSIYEVSCDIRDGAPVLGYFKFLFDPSWDSSVKPWCSAAVAGVYLGLEHGEFNTACYAFLEDAGILTGGPLQGWNEDRPSQQNLAYDWSALTPGAELEIWIYFNTYGYPTPFSPTYVPVAEIWVRALGIDAVPVQLCRIPVGALGTFPPIEGGDTPNFRVGPSNVARLFFGFSGDTYEGLVLEDWALFPDYRISVSEGVALAGSSIEATPDGPVEYRAADGLPTQVSPGRWMHLSDAGAVRPNAYPYFVPGQKKTPTYTVIEKNLPAPSGFEKQEPRLEAGEGFMVEAFLAGLQHTKASDQTGMGFLVEDGYRSFRMSLLATTTDLTVGLLVDGTNPDSYESYLYPINEDDSLRDVDWTTLKKVRVTGDYLRGMASLYIEDEFVGEAPIGSLPAAPGPAGRVAFGHLVSLVATSELQVAYLNYLTRYQAWEGRDSIPPDDPPYDYDHVVGGDVGTSLVEGILTISKNSFGVSESCNYYTKLADFSESMGILVDFQAKVDVYTDATGRGYASPCWVGAGIELLLGTKKLLLGFFDCGTFGRKIGIVPGSGSIDDIVNQTELGQAFSASVDWTQMQNYRVVCKAFDRIEVWVGNTAGESVLAIPWGLEGFDLPEDVETSVLCFGHFDSGSSSKTEWGYVRFGESSGYDVAVQQKYDTLPAYLFGGRILVLPEFSE